ncbi:DUF952 domain-containing protein [Sandaracinobacteroides sp. A072]|uniref:DUF952 domain-containing protein n=1 Tax=Sandaracinobacteroides sp. A072 TaxID=3461146 RepID=UPI00404126DF
MAIYKIFRAGEWAAFEAGGRFEGSADDLRDGFIHLSTGEQLEGSISRHFSGERGLVIAEIRAGDDPALRWEESRGGALFPHLYRPLLLADVASREVRS